MMFFNAWYFRLVLIASALLLGAEGCFIGFKRTLLESFGKCPNPLPSVVTGFDQTQFLGRWFEIQRFRNFFQSGDCVTADYSLNGDGSIKVINAQRINDKVNFIEGTASVPDPTMGALVVNFPQNPFPTTEPNYRILETDYTSYAVVYSCSSPLLGVKLEFSWILSRTENFDNAFLDELKSRLNADGIPVQRYNPTNQNDCPRLEP